MMTTSNGNIFRVTGHLCGEFTGRRWIPPHKGQWRGAWMCSLIFAWTNGWINNQPWGWWFETPSRPLWRHSNGNALSAWAKCIWTACLLSVRMTVFMLRYLTLHPIHHWLYHQTSNITRTLVGNDIVDHSDVVGESPVSAVPATSSLWTEQLYCAKTAARRDEQHFSFGIWYLILEIWRYYEKKQNIIIQTSRRPIRLTGVFLYNYFYNVKGLGILYATYKTHLRKHLINNDKKSLG